MTWALIWFGEKSGLAVWFDWVEKSGLAVWFDWFEESGLEVWFDWFEKSGLTVWFDWFGDGRGIIDWSLDFDCGGDRLGVKDVVDVKDDLDAVDVVDVVDAVDVVERSDVLFWIRWAEEWSTFDKVSLWVLDGLAIDVEWLILGLDGGKRDTLVARVTLCFRVNSILGIKVESFLDIEAVLIVL